MVQNQPFQSESDYYHLTKKKWSLYLFCCILSGLCVSVQVYYYINNNSPNDEKDQIWTRNNVLLLSALSIWLSIALAAQTQTEDL